MFTAVHTPCNPFTCATSLHIMHPAKHSRVDSTVTTALNVVAASLHLLLQGMFTPAWQAATAAGTFLMAVLLLARPRSATSIPVKNI